MTHEFVTATSRRRSGFRRRLIATVAVLLWTAGAQAGEEGAFNAAYTYTAVGQTRAEAPSATAMSGTASFGAFLTNNFLLAGSTQTFTSVAAPGADRSSSYGVTKLEANRDWLIWPSQGLHLAGDYTITLPTNGNNTPGVEHYAHTLLAVVSRGVNRYYYELDAGDYISGRDAAPGYKHTALLTLVGQRNSQPDGNGMTNLDAELDASPRSESTPASVVLTLGADHTFRKTNLTLTALALVGLTANDPAIGVSIRLKYTGSFKKGETNPREAPLSLSRMRRLERTRFGTLGRF
jgi:hypothetical protein